MAPTRANGSDVWRYMEKTDDGKAKCKFCAKSYVYSGGCTSNLMNHLKVRLIQLI